MNDSNHTEKLTDQQDTAPAYVVGIGSSAGGLEALRPLIRALEPSANLAIIIAQHLSPQHDSLMTSLLARETTISVVLAEDGVLLQRGVIHVTPPNADVTVSDGRLHLSPPEADHGPRPSINRLLQSIAEVYGGCGIGVVLSGTGLDGANGMRSLKAAEGLTIAQEPVSAKYDSMPLATIRIGAADLILPPDQIGTELSRLSQLPAPLVRQSDVLPPQSLLVQVVKHVAEVTGYNFQSFRDSTLSRQVDRRIAVLRLGDRDAYLRELERNPREAWLLQRNLLVSVTQFFRDPGAFESLGATLQERFRKSPEARELRVWVAGCATGEEAYSLGILLARSLGGPHQLKRLKLFATDIDDAALNEGRRGVYHASALEALDQQLVETYFNRHPEGWRVIDALKEAMVFAHHDLETAPPFTRMDLVSCRNTLIYFKSPLQEQVLRKFHYALNHDGYLFLGSAEAVGTLSSAFVPVDANHRIFQRIPTADPLPLYRGNISIVEPQRTAARQLLGHRSSNDSAATQDFLPGLLHELYTPPSLLLDENLIVRESLGKLHPFCELPSGRMRAGVFDLVRPPLHQELRFLLMQLRNHEGVHRSRTIELDAGSFQMIGRRVLNTTVGNGYVLSFEEHQATPAAPTATDAADISSEEIQQLKHDLLIHRESLRTSLEELETANEELQAMNEELQATTEELQASNEELETANEELQASNEELTTVNQELQVRSSELTVTNNDLEGILQTISQGVVIVDGDLRITRHSTNATRIFGLVAGDIGKKLADIPCHVSLEKLESRLHQVLQKNQREILEVHDPRSAFLVQIEPYRPREDASPGAILAFADISELHRARQALAESNQNFQIITEALQEVVWVWSPDMRYLLYASPRLAELTGYPVAEFPVQIHFHQTFIHPDDRQRVALEINRRRNQGWSLEYRLMNSESKIYWVQDQTSPIRDSRGLVTSLVGNLSDITARKEAELEVRSTADFHEAVFNNPLSAISALDLQGHLVKVNQAFCDYLGYTEKELLGKHFSDITHPEDIHLDEQEFAELLAHRKPRYAIEKRYLHCSGDTRWGEVTVQRLDTPNRYEAFTISMVKDVTERKQWEVRLAQQANTDQLTGLPNRHRFLQELEREISLIQRDNRQAAVLFLDLDGFKDVNDTLGHAEGDRVLQEIAGRIRYQTRRENLVARLGGDEFALLLRDVRTIDDINQAVERLLSRIAEPLQMEQIPIHLSSSIGIALAPSDATGITDLMRMADTAMYASKQAGGNRYTFFSAEMNDGLKLHLSLKHAVKSTLEQKCFYPVFQPVIALKTGEVAFLEALLRWPAGQLPDIGVGALVSFCESTGLIQAIGQSIFHQALEQVAPLRQKFGAQARVAVNLSVRQLEDPTFSNAVLHLSPAHAYEMLVVEITETLLIENRQRALEVLQAFRDKGAWLAIDDFGKDYSSLGRLEQIRPDIIKIDGDLLPHDEQDTMRRSFCEAITVMASGMNAQVVAEGIETVEQLAFVRQLGCDYGQGYLFARPERLENLAVQEKTEVLPR